MLAHQERLDVLQSLGLTTSEARVYLALLQTTEAKASEVAQASKVPRGRIYDVLDRLHGRGLVEVVPATPRRYRAVPLASFLEKRREALRAQTEEVERNLKTLASQFTPQARESPESTGEFLVYRKRRAVMRKMREMIERATHEVLITSSEGGAIRDSRAFLASYEDRAGAGVDLKMSCNVTERNLEAIQALQKFVQVRHQEVGDTRASILVVDAEEVLLSDWNPDDEDLFQGNDIAIWSNGPGAVRALWEVANDAWERGSDPTLRYWEMEKGIPPGRVGIVPGSHPMEQALALAVKFARAEIWSSTLNTLVNAEGENFMARLKPLSHRKMGRRLLVEYDGGSLEGARTKADLGWEIRVSKSLTLGRFLGIDRSQLLIFVESLPPSQREPASSLDNETHPKLLVRVTDRGTVEAFRAVFEQAWRRATPLEQFVAEAGASASMARAEANMEVE